MIKRNFLKLLFFGLLVQVVLVQAVLVQQVFSADDSFTIENRTATAVSVGVGLVSGGATGLTTYLLCNAADKRGEFFPHLSKLKRNSLKLLFSCGLGGTVGGLLGVGTFSGLRGYTVGFKSKEKIRHAEYLADRLKNFEFTDAEKAALSKADNERTNNEKKVIKGLIRKLDVYNDYRGDTYSRNSESPEIYVGPEINRINKENSRNRRRIKKLIKDAKEIDPNVKISDEIVTDVLSENEDQKRFVSALEDFIYVEEDFDEKLKREHEYNDKREDKYVDRKCRLNARRKFWNSSEKIERRRAGVERTRINAWRDMNMANIDDAVDNEQDDYEYEDEEGEGKQE